MQLKFVAEHQDIVRLAWEGEIRQDQVRPVNPFEDLLGPGVFARKVLLNLAQASFIDSSGIGWLRLSQKRFHDTGGKLILHTVPEAILHIIQFLHLESQFHIAANEAEAVQLAQSDQH